MANKIVYTYAVGDLLHIGHLRTLQHSKELGDYLIVGVLNDKAVWAYKRQPIIPFEQRMELISNLKCVDEVVEQNDVDPTDNLEKLYPDIVTHAHHENDSPLHWRKACECMEMMGKEAIRLEYYDGQSTSNIINTIRVRQWARPRTLRPMGVKSEKVNVS